MHSFPAENIEMTSINAVYSNINFKLSVSVCLPFLRTSFGEMSEIRRRVCLKFYAHILHFSFNQFHTKSFGFFSREIYFIKAIENFFPRRWENSRQLCEPETKSRVGITVSNSPSPSRVYIRLCKHGKRFLLLK